MSGPDDPADGTLRTMSRVDLTRWQPQLSYPLYPVYVSLQSSDPAQSGELPEPVPTPTLDDGPHLNYVGQWLIFATLTVIVYPLMLRRMARHKAGRDRPEDDGPLTSRSRGADASSAAVTDDPRPHPGPAAVAACERVGAGRTSLEDVAQRGGRCRGPRSTGTSPAAATSWSRRPSRWEVGRFWSRLAEADRARAGQLEDRLVTGLVFGAPMPSSIT